MYARAAASFSHCEVLCYGVHNRQRLCGGLVLLELRCRKREMGLGAFYPRCELTDAPLARLCRMADVDDIAAGLRGMDLDDDEDVITEMRAQYGDLFSAKRLQRTLRAMNRHRCLTCDVIFPTIKQMKRHLKKNGHWVGKAIKEHIKIFLRERGFPEDKPLIEIKDDDLETHEDILSRDILLVKNACYVHRSERD
jgi:uncharacterized protein YneF (UPF0154 family)